MKLIVLTVFSFLLMFNSNAQQLSAEEILNNSIAYHDPDSEWKTFAYRLIFEQDLPEGKKSGEIVELDNSKSFFKTIRVKDSLEIGVLNDSCFVVSTKKPDCSRIKMFRNYYSYLWGLPMKLKDEGTMLDEKVIKGKFDSYNCYILRVPYEKDTWYFYIDQTNFALRGYEFFKEESKKIGERIVLKNEIMAGNMKIPQERKWNNTHDQKYLATDKLVKVVPLK